MREGEPGELFYVVADGELEVSAEGRALRVLRRGELFGEIALLRERAAHRDRAGVDIRRLYALDRAPFLAAVAAHPVAADEAERVVDERLAAGQATIAP